MKKLPRPSDVMLMRRETTAEVLARLFIQLEGTDLPLATMNTVRQLRRPSVHWQRAQPGAHVIDGVPLPSSLAGLDAAWCATGAPGQMLFRAAEFCTPGAAHPDVTVRASLKRAVAALAAVHAGLAEAVDSVRVLRGFVVYPTIGRIDIRR